MAFVKVFFSFTLFLASYGLAEACYENWNCPYRQKCCKRRFFSSGDCSDSCIGKSCSVNSNCGGESVYCCDKICRSSCLGYSCLRDSDCGSDNEYCCNYTCQEGVCGLGAWLTVIVLSVFGLVATIVSVVLCAVCAHRRRTRGLVVTHAPSTVPATATAMVGGSNVYYVQGPPPPYYPPAQKPQA